VTARLAEDGIGAVRDRARPDAGLAVASGVEEGRAFRGTDPLVEVAGVPGGPEPIELERQHPWRMGAVDERLDPPLGERRHDPPDREGECRRARDMADEEQPGPLGRGSEERVDDRVVGDGRERNPGDDDPGAVALGDVPQDVDRRVVLVVVRQELVAGREAQGSDDRVDRPGRVRDEGQIVRIGADERAELRSRPGQEDRQVAGEELDGLGLHPVTPAVLGLEHRPRGRAERAVVQEGDRGIERPVAGQVRRHRRMMTGTLGPWVRSTRWTRSSSC
jgi:hypothetical protein